MVVTIFTIVICKILGTGNRVTKYFAMLGIVVAICVQSCALTYHVYMLMILIAECINRSRNTRKQGRISRL